MQEILNRYLEVYPQAKEMAGGELGVRTYMWNFFAALVAQHVQEYTIPQYGDYPNDNIAQWSADDCLKQIQKYANRLFTSSRGEDELKQDLKKIAHYSQLALFKKEGLEEKFGGIVTTGE